MTDDPTTPPPASEPPATSPGSPDEPPAPTAADDDTGIGGARGGPKRLLVAGAAAAVVFAALVVLTRGDGGGGGGGCMSGLTDHLWDDAGVVSGSDLERADDAGIELDSLDELYRAADEYGFLPDPLTSRIVSRATAGDPEALAGYDADDVDCWIGDQVVSFVAEGDFDADRVAGAEAGEDAAVDGDLLAYTPDDDPADWLARTDGGDTAVGDAVRKLDDLGAIIFSGVPAPDDDSDLRWVGLGLARDGDWQLVAVWAFDDGDAAEEGLDAVVAAVEEGEVPSMIEGDVADRIDVDGSLLTLAAPMRVAPSEWRTPFRQLDPMFGALDDFFGDDGDSDGD